MAFDLNIAITCHGKYLLMKRWWITTVKWIYRVAIAREDITKAIAMKNKIIDMQWRWAGHEKEKTERLGQEMICN